MGPVQGLLLRFGGAAFVDEVGGGDDRKGDGDGADGAEMGNHGGCESVKVSLRYEGHGAG